MSGATLSGLTYPGFMSKPRCTGALCPAGAGPPSIDVVRKIQSPQTIGDEWPRPGIAVFHATFSVFDQLSG